MNRFLPLLFFTLLLSLFLFCLLIGGSNENQSPLIGKSVPSYELSFMSQNSESLNDLINEPGYKLINFWASWCLPCLVEHPILMNLKGKKNLKIIGINYKDKREDAVNFLIENGDSENLIKKISELLSDTEKSKNMGSEGRKFVENNFSWNIIAKKFSTDIKQLLNKNN